MLYPALYVGMIEKLESTAVRTGSIRVILVIQNFLM